MKGRYWLSLILQMGKLSHRVKMVEPQLRSSLFFAVSKAVLLIPLVPCGLRALVGACVLSILCPHFPKGSKERKLRSHLSSTKGSQGSAALCLSTSSGGQMDCSQSFSLIHWPFLVPVAHLPPSHLTTQPNHKIHRCLQALQTGRMK